MLNVLWAGMVLVGIVYGACTGTLDAINTQIFDSAKEAVSLSLTMAGTMAVWCGVLEIGQQAGIVSMLTKVVKPLVRWLYPNLPRGHEVEESIAFHMIANVLGLGNAATPVGLRTMEQLAQIAKEQGQDPKVASKEMCTFLILNISSLQLIPMNMIAYRSQYGSVAPTRIVGPALVATLVSTVAAVCFCRIKDRKVKRID